MWTDRERTKFSKILLDFIFLLWFYWTKIVDEKKRVENKTKHALSVFSLFRIRHIYHIFLSILQSQHFSMCHILLLHTTEHTHTQLHRNGCHSEPSVLNFMHTLTLSVLPTKMKSVISLIYSSWLQFHIWNFSSLSVSLSFSLAFVPSLSPSHFSLSFPFVGLNLNLDSLSCNSHSILSMYIYEINECLKH